MAALLSNTTGLGNTATGAAALLNNTTGNVNTATGINALLSNTIGFENTAIGFEALYSNISGDHNTASGAQALLTNDTGGNNTATGYQALLSNTGGDGNTATGVSALASNTTGDNSTAIGYQALFSNTTGIANTAVGFQALNQNTFGFNNNAFGAVALTNHVTGNSNNAFGAFALNSDTNGAGNSAFGNAALLLSTGIGNTAVGFDAGDALTSGNGNVYIGSAVEGMAVEDNHTYIRNINTTNVSGGGTDTVTVNLATGLLGHLTSSRRYKEDIKPIADASEALYRLNPVSYRYKREIDSTQSPAFGLIAEEVAEVNPALVAHNPGGQPESVHYEMINAMLLNEFLKAHRKMEAQQRQIDDLTARLDQQAAQIQKVNARLAAASPSDGGLEASKFATGRIRRGGPAPQVVLNDQ